MPRRRPSGTRVALLTNSYDTAWRGVPDGLIGYVAARRRDVAVDEIDVLDGVMPKAHVLARLAYQGDSAFFPKGVTTFEEFVARRPEHAVASEACEGGLARLVRRVRECEPSVIVAATGLAGLLGVAVARELEVPAVTCACSWSDERLLADPRSDLVFVWTRRSAEELVVAGVPYDRVVVTGPPASAAPSRGAGGTAPGPVICAGDAATDMAARLGGRGVLAVVAPGRAGVGPGGSAPVGIDPPTRAALLDMMADAAMLVAHPASPLVLEALSVGLPVIVYTRVPEGVAADVDALVCAGAVMSAPDAEYAVRVAHYLLDNPWRRDQMTDAARRLAQSNGARLVCERAIALVAPKAHDGASAGA